MEPGAAHSKCERDRAEHRTQWCGSPARSRCPKVLVYDQPAPTSRRRANGPDRRQAYADSCAWEHARPPAGAEMQDWRREAPRENVPALPKSATRKDLRAADSVNGHAG